MKRLLLATTALALAGPALAGPPAPAAPSLYSWTGCSVGAHVGAGRGTAHFSDPNAPLNTLLASPGQAIDDVGNHAHALGGVQAGCDYQFATHWVIGAAGDFAWTGIQEQAIDPFFAGKNNGPMSVNAKNEWIATATARMGYAWDRVLIFGRGGAAWSRDQFGVQNSPVWGNPFNACGPSFAATIACNPTGTSTRTGWTAGFGAEWAFAGNWTAGFEYNYYRFGTKTVSLSDPNVLPTGGAVSSAPINIRDSVEALKLTLSYRFGMH
jgi:outer membrane immunogenic protein